MVLLSFLFLFANIYAVRKIMRYGAQIYLYDKLLVAYQVGAEKGLEDELKRVFSDDKPSFGLREAGDFKKELAGIKDPEKFLSNIVEEKKSQITILRRLRSLSFVFIMIIFLARIMLFLRRRSRSRTSF